MGYCERKKSKLQRVRCRLYPFICWIIIKEGPGNFSGGRSPHWVNHINLCLYCIVYLLCFHICFILLLHGPVFQGDEGMSEESGESSQVDRGVKS
jgi:hypothetical protein